jgi:hypothetical protein
VDNKTSLREKREREKERGNPKTENTGEVEKVIGSKRDRAGSAKPNLGTGVNSRVRTGYDDQRLESRMK